MPNQNETGSQAAEATLDAQQLPGILAVIEGTLTIPSDDHDEAINTFLGFQYLMAREFRRQQPALALFYEFEFTLQEVGSGSIILYWRAELKLKERLHAVVKKLGGPGVVISLVLALPGAINETEKLIHDLAPPVQTELRYDLPHSPPTVEIKVVRAPDNKDVSDPEDDNIVF